MAQFFRSDGWVKTTLGPAVTGASIYVCTQPVTDITDIPPAPLATLYADPLGQNTLPQPVSTDGFGHYDFYIATGTYTIVVVYSGKIQQIYLDQSIGGTGSGTFTLNGLSGSVNIQAGTNISIAVVGSSILVSGQSSGVSSVNSLTGVLNITAGSGISVSNVGQNIQVSGTVVSFTPNLWRGWIFDGNPNQAIHGPYGCLPNYSSTITATINGTTSEPSYLKISTNVGGRSQFSLMGVTSIATNQISIGRTISYIARLLAVSNVTFRSWLAITDTTTNNPAGLDTNNPNQNVIGFRFSTSAGDTTWKAYVGTSSASFTIVDTGSVLDTINGHIFSFTVSQSSIVFSIDGTVVATITSNIPASSVLVQDWLTVTDLSGSASKSIAIANAFWQTNT